MNLIIYPALALTFFVIATGLAGVVRPFLSPRWQAAILAAFTALVWAPVRWWGGTEAGGEAIDAGTGGWVPLIGAWLLDEPTNRPGLDATSFALTALLAFILIRRWQTRRERQTETLH